MMHSRIAGLAALFAAAVSAQDVPIGFNYGNLMPSGETKFKDDYLMDFGNAKELEGGNDLFTSARLYTMIQKGTETDPNEAIEAAIETGTTMLLGIWCSAGDASFAKELQALENAIKKWGDDFTKLVVGLSVGSEDLYRVSETGIKNESGVGAGPDTLVKYIKQVKEKLKDGPLKDVKIGHVDTADVWVNGTNKPVIENIDWIGFDAYPYFESTRENDISNAGKLFWQGYNKTEVVAEGKPVWITETGWPVSGEDQRDAIPSVENAKKFWDEVGCRVIGRIPTWWYILEDDGAVPSFAISKKGSKKPLFPISCENVEIDWSIGSPEAATDNSTSTDESSESNESGSGSGGSRGGSGNGGSSTNEGASEESGTSGNQESEASFSRGMGISAIALLAASVAFLA